MNGEWTNWKRINQSFFQNFIVFLEYCDGKKIFLF